MEKLRCRYVPVTLKMVNVAYKYQNQKSVNYFMWHRSRRNIDGIVESWYHSCSNIAGTPMPQFFPTGSVFQQIRPNKWYQQILREKIRLPGLFEIISSPMESNFSPKTVFSGRRHSRPKYIFGHYSSYIRDRRDFKPPRVVYFFARNTMVAFILLYLEKWGW